MDTRDIFPAWALDTDEVLQRLEVTKEGLTDHEASFRRRHFGGNSLPRRRHFTALSILAKQFVSPLVFILIGAAILTALLQETIETVVIILAIVVNAGLGFYQEYRAENTLEKLLSYIRERSRVRRDGMEQEVDSSQLVPGDIIHLAYGERIPADARIIESNMLSVDEALLTGESLPVTKNAETLAEGTPVADRTNMVHAGTMVTEGFGIALVTATGSLTELGRIAGLVSTTHDSKTPLQKSLLRLAWVLFAGISVLTILIFFLGLSRGAPLFEMLLMAAAIAVGAVPEALPIALTVILAVGVERLALQKGIMRNLATTETLGSATVIMTDKTGTLTEANLRLTDIVTPRVMYGELAGTKREALSDFWHSETMKVLIGALSDSDVTIENPQEPEKEWRFSGRPFAVGVVRAAHEHGITLAELLQNRKPPLLPFNSTNKFSIFAGKHATYVIGAPEILIRRSTLTKDEYIAAENWIHTASSEGHRLLGVAVLPHAKEAPYTADDAKNLEFLGTIVFKDPVRADAGAALHKITRLGARVIMVTGDLKGTALAVAHELKWDVDEHEVLTGEEFRALSKDDVDRVLARTKIYARVTPEDKLRIGGLLRAQGEIVAMTGDGVNDAPALKAMDIGVALGSGSDVAKSAADLVLLDDNFKTIVAAIEEGRRILENVRKVFVYLVSTSLSEVFLIGGALIVGLPLPLSALQIIWINFFSDSLPAISYAFDKHYSRERESQGTGAIFSTEVKVLTLTIGLASSLLLFLLYWLMLHYGVSVEHARSTLFLCFSLSVLAISFSLRRLRTPFAGYSLTSNWYLTGSVAIGALLTIASVTVPFLENIFKLQTPAPKLWLLVVVWILFTVTLVEISKWCTNRLVRTA